MESQKFIKRTTILLLIIVISLGIISRLIISNEGLSYFAVSIYSLFSNNSNPDKFIETFSLISQSWIKLAVLIAGVYILLYTITNLDTTIQTIRHPIRGIFHKYHSIREKAKYRSKQRKFKKATKAEINIAKKRIQKKKINLDTSKFKKSRKWPDDGYTQKQIIKDKVEEFISTKEGYTIPEVMRALENDFDLTIIEKNSVLDNLKSLVSSSLRLSKYKKKKEVKKK